MRRTLTLTVLGVFAFLGTVLAGGQLVSAAPTTPGQVEAQIDAKWNELEPVIERYNAIHGQLIAGQKQVAALQAQIRPLQVQVDLAMTRVGAVSAGLYMNGGPAAQLNAILSAGSPTAFADQLSVLNQLASQQADTVADAKALKDKYDAQKKPIDDKVAQLKQQNDALQAQAKTINAQISQLNKLRLALYGSGSGTGNLKPVACPQVYTGDAGSKAAAFACRQIGKPYVWAADGPGSYDCSGLTKASWASVGISLPHNAYQQKQVTTRISRAELRPGDLIFMYSDVHHVVIYVGNGWDVAASTFGVPVRMQQPFTDMGRINSYGRPHS